MDTLWIQDMGTKTLENKLVFSRQTQKTINNLLRKIDEFNGSWKTTEKIENRYLKELKKIATIESIGSSTRIEGATLTDNEIKTLLSNIKITKLETRDQQEVIGYYDVMELILDNYNEIKLTENYIKQLHNILLKHSSKDKRHKGSYKNLPNTVGATYPDGTVKIIFNPTEPALVQKEMQELIEWTTKELTSENGEHPLLIIALFIYEFLSIHPFQDGNGRISRLVTNLLLLKSDYNFIRYISFENLIEQKKKQYYKSLMECQRSRMQNREKIDTWVLFFLNSICELTIKLQIKYEEYNKSGGYLNNRRKQILDFIQQTGDVQIADIVSNFNDISRNTVKKDVTYLLNENLIKKTGQGRGTVYSVKNS